MGFILSSSDLVVPKAVFVSFCTSGNTIKIVLSCLHVQRNGVTVMLVRLQAIYRSSFLLGINGDRALSRVGLVSLQRLSFVVSLLCFLFYFG